MNPPLPPRLTVLYAAHTHIFSFKFELMSIDGNWKWLLSSYCRHTINWTNSTCKCVYCHIHFGTYPVHSRSWILHIILGMYINFQRKQNCWGNETQGTILCLLKGKQRSKVKVWWFGNWNPSNLHFYVKQKENVCSEHWFSIQYWREQPSNNCRNEFK